MRPSSRLPLRILASVGALVLVAILATCAWPGVVLPLAVAALVAGMVGGAWVGLSASRNRRDSTRSGWKVLNAPAGDGGAGVGEPIWAVAVFALAVAVLVADVVPGLYAKDAGELGAAVRGLGVPHPTGFAAYCLVGKAFDLLPVGAGAFRLNLLSAVATAAAAALAYLLALELGRGGGAGGGLVRDRLAALVAPVALLASHLTWQHATTTEVYAFSIAGLALALLAWARGVLRDDARWLAVGAVATGLGLGGHVTWPLYAGAAGLLATLAFARRHRSVGLPAALALLAGLGALVGTYLAAAASRGPYMNWGDPSDLAGVFAHVSGARIRHAFQDHLAGVPWAMVQVNLGRSVRVLADGTLANWPAAILGLVALGLRHPALALAGAGLIVGDVVFSARINPMGIIDWQTLLPATLFVSVLAGSGAVAGTRRAPRLAVAVIVVALGAALWQVRASPADRRMARVTAAQDVVTGFLGRLPPGATVFTSSDNLSSGLAGMQVFESARPDVLVLVKQHLGDTGYVQARMTFHQAGEGRRALADTLAARPFESAGESPADAVVRAIQAAGAGGPVWVELGEGRVDGALRPLLEPDFPAFRWGTDGASGTDAMDAAREAALARVATADRWVASWLAGFLRTMGTWASARQDFAGARDLTAAALRVAPDDTRSLYNLGVMVRAEGDPEGALRLFEAAVSTDPSYLRAWQAIAKTASSAGRPDQAQRALDFLRRLLPPLR